jgi:PDZ domain-containing secreted protein/Zn-dependent protease
MTSSFTFMRIRGIEIGAHWSWLFVFVLVVYSLTTGVFPDSYPNLSDEAYVAMGITAASLFFVSILLHELGHAFTALNEGMKMEGITLWLFGGVARFSGMFPSPTAEFRVAIAGPLVTLAIGIVLWLSGWALDSLGGPDALTGVVSYLAQINLIVLVFNLVPAMPLDGGRVLRSWLWRRQRSFSAATLSAARAGKLFGGALVLVGVLNLFGGGSTGGLWLVFLGWFLVQAAQAEVQYALVRQTLGERSLGDLMTPDPEVVSADLSIAEFLDRNLSIRAHSSYPVMDGDRVVGLVSLRQGGAVPAEERGTRTVRDEMTPLEEIPTGRPDEQIVDRFDDLQSPPRRLLVLRDGGLAGIVSVTDALGAIERGQIGTTGEPAVRSAGVLVWIVVGTAIVLAAGYLYHPPYAVIEPGPTADVTDEVSISGIETTDLTGEYLLVAVNVTQPNGLGLIVSLLDPDDELLPLDEVIPPSVDPERYRRAQQEVFDQSRDIAAAAAARSAGLPVDLNGSGAEVIDVVEGSPAADALRPGDVIVAIDGTEIEVATQVGEILNSSPVGTAFQLTVERDGRTIEVRIETRQLPEPQGAAIGAYLSTEDFSIDLPFEITFPDSDIGGSSAGLAHALAIADILSDEDYANGRTIVATGTIDLDGTVGPIGGLDAKAAAAEDAGADLFIVPQSQLHEIDEEGLDVRGVTTLMRSLQLLLRTAA